MLGNPSIPFIAYTRIGNANYCFGETASTHTRHQCAATPVSSIRKTKPTRHQCAATPVSSIRKTKPTCHHCATTPVSSIRKTKPTRHQCATTPVSSIRKTKPTCHQCAATPVSSIRKTKPTCHQCATTPVSFILETTTTPIGSQLAGISAFYLTHVCVCMTDSFLIAGSPISWDSNSYHLIFLPRYY